MALFPISDLYRFLQIRIFLSNKLFHLFGGPVRQEFVLKNAGEIRAVPARFFSVPQTGTADRPANGMGLAAKSVMGIPNMDWGK